MKKEVKSNKQRADEFRAKNLKLGRKPRNMWTTLEEHNKLKLFLLEIREGAKLTKTSNGKST
jgi:hypothetical protein